MTKKRDPIIAAVFPLLFLIAVIGIGTLTIMGLVRTGVLWVILDGLSQ